LYACSRTIPSPHTEELAIASVPSHVDSRIPYGKSRSTPKLR
jgi:hypothetical protein